MAFAAGFALLDSAGRKIKHPGCRVVKVPAGAQTGEVRFGPNKGEGPWPEAHSLAALDEDGDPLAEAPIGHATGVVVGPGEHVVVGFSLTGAFTVGDVTVEPDACYIARGAPPEAPRGGGAAHTLHIHDAATGVDVARRV